MIIKTGYLLVRLKVLNYCGSFACKWLVMGRQKDEGSQKLNNWTRNFSKRISVKRKANGNKTSACLSKSNIIEIKIHHILTLQAKKWTRNKKLIFHTYSTKPNPNGLLGEDSEEHPVSIANYGLNLAVGGSPRPPQAPGQPHWVVHDPFTSP